MADEPIDEGFTDEENDEPWDEFKWEESFKESDTRADKFGKLTEKYQDNPDAENLIAKEMGWDWIVEGLEAKERGELREEDDEFSEDEDDEGEEWKEAAGIRSDEEHEREYPAVYHRARKLAYAAIDFVRQIEGKYSGETCIGKFVEGATVPATKIAGSQAFMDDVTMMGGAIANCKRGLAAANQCLQALQEMRDKQIIDQAGYVELYKQAKTVRDELAIHITEIREKFQRGIP